MLFNSYQFIFVYLPLVFLGFYLIGHFSELGAALWLGMASVVFYSWWNWHFTFILLLSILGNFAAGYVLSKRKGPVPLVLGLSVAANILALCYFKYMNFFVATTEQLFGMHLAWQNIVLPIGISFFTFTQIAFLVDTAKGKASEVNFIHYLLFVTYFPHLIAGPILHHAEMMPQFRKRETYSPRAQSLAVGLTVFMFGLFKKVVLADSISPYADFAFQPVHSHQLSLVHAWVGTLAYTFQIYFDFSAYTDMAIGVSQLFNIKLPPNFESPYKALSIVDFWRRWHMTLSRFLRDYLYIPLGGNRGGQVSRYANLLITMALGGLWHGAGWTFVIWGVLHGSYLMINHAWLYVAGGRQLNRVLSWGLTFTAVVVAWVFFRAPDLNTALGVLKGMAGMQGIQLPAKFSVWLGPVAARLPQLQLTFADISIGDQGATLRQVVPWLVGLFAIAVFAPNIRQIMGNEELVVSPDKLPGKPALPMFRWKPGLAWALASFIAFVVSLSQMTKVSQFLYFQF